MLGFNTENGIVSFYIDGKINPLISETKIGFIPNLEKIDDILNRPGTAPIEIKAIHFGIAKAIVDNFNYDRKINNEPTNSDAIAIDVKNFIRDKVFNLATYLDIDIDMLTSYAYTLFRNRFGTVYFNTVSDPITGLRNLFSKKELIDILDKDKLIREVIVSISEALI